MLRSLTWYWRTSLALVAGTAVATAVLTGALVVGDSVRGSLEQLAAERLGGIGSALVAPRFVAEELASRLDEAGDPPMAPAILVPGSVVVPDSGRRATGVTIVGIDDRFLDLYGASLDLDREPGQIFPSIALNRPLALELGVAVGEQVVVSFGSVSTIPRETLIGRQDTEDAVDTLRVTIRHLLPDAGLGRFGLTAGQAQPATAFVRLSRIQRALAQEGRVNAILAGSDGAEDLDAALHAHLVPEDVGIRFRSAGDALVVDSHELIVPPPLELAAVAAGESLGLEVARVSTYLANSIRAGDRSVPYSTVAAIDGRGVTFPVDDGAVPVVLNQWAADQLGVNVGDQVELDYYEVGFDESLLEASAELRVAGIIPTDGLGADPTLTPDFPGMSDADDMSSWDPPFPVDLDLVRPVDEAYWDDHRAAPKAFVPFETGDALWGTRFGDVTSVRLLGPTPDRSVDSDAVAAHLLDSLDPADLGLGFRPVRRIAQEASRGATDFSGLFVGFSMFLIASALLLTGLLFRLGMEQRAREIGLLRATGFTERAVRRRFLAQGLLLSVAGAVVGTGGAALYGAVMMYGLRTWWLPAIGTPILFLHLDPITLVSGALGSIVLAGGVVVWALRQLRATSTVGLLAGLTRDESSPRPRRRARTVAVGGLVGGGILLAWTILSGHAASPAAAFGAGAMLLVGGIALSVSHASTREADLRPEISLRGPAVLAIGARNAVRFADRSTLSIALVAAASFVIVLVGAYRADHEPDVLDPASGAGGYSLMATSDVGLVGDLSSETLRNELGFETEAESVVTGMNVEAFRVKPGEDASCLNLYRPTEPRLIGAPPSFVAEDRFTFQSALDDRENPWTLLDDGDDEVVPVIGDYNSVLWILHSGLGKEIPIRAENGDEVRLRIVGLLHRSLFQSELIMSEASFLRLFPSQTGSRLFLVDPGSADAEDVAQALEASLDRFGFDAVSTRERLRAFGAVERTYLSTFQALGGLGLILGTIGLGIVMLRNVIERRRELAALRAFGFQSSLLARLVLAENAVLLTIGLGVGAVAGLAAGVPNLLASGRTVPWGEVAATLVAIWAVGMISTIGAARTAARAPLLATLKEE